jgi:hypothetical protein
MKKLFFVSMLVLMAAGCDIDVEPRYDPAVRVTGSYQVEEYSLTYDEYTSYDIRIYQNGYNRVLISNFYGIDIDVDAEVRGNVLIIPFQVREGYEIEGRATIDINELHFSYSVRDTYEYRGPRNYCDAEAWIY